MYTLRDANGVMRAKLDNRLAYKIINESKGYFRRANYSSGKFKTIFELEEDAVLSAGGLKLYIWKSETIVPD